MASPVHVELLESEGRDDPSCTQPGRAPTLDEVFPLPRVPPCVAGANTPTAAPAPRAAPRARGAPRHRPSAARGTMDRSLLSCTRTRRPPSGRSSRTRDGRARARAARSAGVPRGRAPRKPAARGMAWLGACESGRLTAGDGGGEARSAGAHAREPLCRALDCPLRPRGGVWQAQPELTAPLGSQSRGGPRSAGIKGRTRPPSEWAVQRWAPGGGRSSWLRLWTIP